VNGRSMAKLTILSHNVFWFQGKPFESAEPGEHDEKIADELAAFYRGVGANVVCVQEVQSPRAADAMAERLGMAGAYCPGRTFPQYGGAVFGADVVDDSSRDGRTAQRFWQLARHAASGIEVCNIHLPSGRQEGRDRAPAIRVAELSDMLSVCGKTPDVLAGDFNERPGGAVGELLARHGYTDAAVAAGKPHLPTSMGGSRGDYLWLHERILHRLVGYEVPPREALAWTERPGKEYLSDHLPLWITLEPE